MSFNRRMDKHFTIEYYSVIKKNFERATNLYNNMDRSKVHFVKRQNLWPKGYILYYSIHKAP